MQVAADASGLLRFAPGQCFRLEGALSSLCGTLVARGKHEEKKEEGFKAMVARMKTQGEKKRLMLEQYLKSEISSCVAFSLSCSCFDWYTVVALVSK